MKQNLTSIVGTDLWMAPEMLEAKRKYEKDPTKKVDVELLSYKLDVFSLGLITLFALDKDNFISKNNRLNSDETLLKSYLVDFKNSKIVPEEEFICILEEMLAFKPESRLSLEKLHYWIVLNEIFFIHVYINNFSFKLKLE